MLVIGGTFNRTSMESKRDRRFAAALPVMLLIEPVWNRNQKNNSQLLLKKFTFNRTSMESKRGLTL